MDACIMKIICGNYGSMHIGELVDIGSGLQDLKGVFELVYENTRDFTVVELNGIQKIIAKTSVRLCKAGTCTGCNNLHLCKFYLYGDCRASRGRRGCRYCHDMNSEHNSKVLLDNNLQGLDTKELCVLLLQNDNTLLPPVCASYNEGSGQYGLCPEQMSCRRLHICDKYIRGTCSSEVDCPRSHDFFEPHPLKTLEERGIPVYLINSMYSIYQNIKALKMKNNSAKRGCNAPKAVSNKTEICLYYVKGNCRQGDKCWRIHFNMPYRWEVKEKNVWSPLPNNEDIEKDYCNPAKMKSEGANPVCFDTMTCGQSEVRRMSTISSVLQPNFLLTTEWAWYWEDEHGDWVRYASITAEHRMSSITSEDLEKTYHEDSKAVVKFTAANQAYQLSLADMVQHNEKYGTKRNVRRRPVFVSSADAQQIKSRKPPNFSSCKALPSYWDKTMIPENGYKRVPLQSSSEEYLKILGLFQKTMFGFNIQSIERVQNRALWEVFQLRRDQMKKSNTGKYSVEKLLFHGTDSNYINAICQQNFDWRICGTHGTAYGKGSYFARDAKYSHSYTGSSQVRTMFVCRVLVGSYTKGNSSYLRPPSKDGGDTILYDSCVDNVKDPSIFVVFEKHQVYPEYIIQYGEDVWDLFSVVPAAPTARATVAVISSSAPPQAAAALSSVSSKPMTAVASSSVSSNPVTALASSSVSSKPVTAPTSSFVSANPMTALAKVTASSSVSSNPVRVHASSNPMATSAVATASSSASCLSFSSSQPKPAATLTRSAATVPQPSTWVSSRTAGTPSTTRLSSGNTLLQFDDFDYKDSFGYSSSSFGTSTLYSSSNNASVIRPNQRASNTSSTHNPSTYSSRYRSSPTNNQYGRTSSNQEKCVIL